MSEVCIAKTNAAFGYFKASACARAVKKAMASSDHSYNKLNPKQKNFLEKVLLPMLGKRTILDAESELRACTVHSGSCFEIRIKGKDPGLENVVIRFTEKDENSVSYSKGKRVVTFNTQKLDDLSATQAFIQQAFVGHTLHPFSSNPLSRDERVKLHEPAIVPRKIQEDAIEAAKKTMDAGGNKFLFVSPTGTGKSYVFSEVLNYRINNYSKGIHFLISDRLILNKQHAEGLQQTLPEGTGLTIWDSENGGVDSLGELVTKFQNSKEGVVIVVTPKSFQNFVNQISKAENKRAFKGIVRTIVYDEAHHVGASIPQSIIREYVDGKKSQTFLMGATATPLHSNNDVQESFGNNTYWAYLDTPENYDVNSTKTERPFTDIVKQYSMAIQAGELSPIENVHYLLPEENGVEGGSFFKRDEGKVAELNPRNYGKVFSRIEPLFQKHKQGFLSTSSIESAESITKYLKRNYRGKSFAVLHSKLTDSKRNKLLQKFRDGEVDYLVTVGMLDEGLDFPNMSLYVELNNVVSPREALQRMGRTLRIADGKNSVEFVSLHEFNAATAKEDLELAQAVLERRLSIGIHKEFGIDGSRKRDESDSPYNSKPQLLKVIAEAEAFFKREESGVTREMELFHPELEAYFEEHGDLPRSDHSLYRSLMYYRGNKTFQGICSPKLKAMLEESTKGQFHLAMIRAKGELRSHWEQYKELPLAESAFGQKIDRYKGDPEFIKDLSPDLVSALSRDAKQNFINELEAYVAAGGVMPPPRDHPIANRFYSNSSRKPEYFNDLLPLSKAAYEKYKTKPTFLETLSKGLQSYFDGGGTLPMPHLHPLYKPLYNYITRSGISNFKDKVSAETYVQLEKIQKERKDRQARKAKK